MARTPWLDTDGIIVTPSRLHWLDPLIILANVAQALASDVARSLMAHYNAVVEVEQFVEDASAEIESLTSWEDEDG